MTKARDLADNALGSKPKLIDAAGDLLYGTGSDAATRLAIGTVGQVLQVNSGATAPEWAAAAAGGKVLQVVNATTTTQTVSSTLTFVDTTLTATITPTLDTSKVLILISHNGNRRTNGNSSTGMQMRLMRGATTLTTFLKESMNTASTLNQQQECSLNWLDTPATTSATTYKTQFANIWNASSVSVQESSAASSITLIEIGA